MTALPYAHCRLLVPESGVGQRRIGREGVILVAGLRGDAVLAAEPERVEPLALVGEGFLHAGLGIDNLFKSLLFILA